MAARRNRRGRRRNRGRFGFLYKLLSTLVICAAILLGCVVFFRVNTVVVSGQSRYTQEEIIQASGVEQGDNLYALNKSQIARQILTQLPYVDDVILERSPPDTLIIQVTESYPAAVIQSGAEYFLLDSRCKLLERGDAALAQDKAIVLGLEPLAPAVGVRLAVDQSQQAKLDSLKSLLEAIRARQMTGSLTGFIDLTASNEIRFGYGQGLTIVMPMTADFYEKTFQLKRVLETMDQQGVDRQGTLDLTYGDGEAHLLPERWTPDTASTTQTPQTTTPQTTEQPQTDTQGETDEQAQEE
jgi:cell division protein FtsQ